MKVRISLVVISFNEQKNIGRCLASVKDVVDDIVIVDSYSTDDTEKICKDHGARFVQHTFHSHIDQKNWAITQAKYPHILSLDADESLSDSLKENILKVKRNWEFDGYYFNRLTNYCGKWIRHTTWYPSRKLRLWDSRKGAWGGINPHDKYLLERGATMKFLKGDILHYSYYSISEHVKQLNSFSTIQARAYFEKGRKANYLSIIIHTSWRFFTEYFWRLGILDGHHGLVISKNAAHETFLKYSKLRDHCKVKKRIE